MYHIDFPNRNDVISRLHNDVIGRLHNDVIVRLHNVETSYFSDM